MLLPIIYMKVFFIQYIPWMAKHSEVLECSLKYFALEPCWRLSWRSNRHHVLPILVLLWCYVHLSVYFRNLLPCKVRVTEGFSCNIAVEVRVFRRNRPWINPEAVIPSMLGGAMLAVGMCAFVIAIDTLDQAIAYPICTTMPGLVTSLWSILYFREITVRPTSSRPYLSL